LIKQYDILAGKTGDEEMKSREILKEKLDLEEELIVINQELKEEQDKQAFNREELIRQRVKDSQLDSQAVMLKIESEQLDKDNTNLLEDNAIMEAKNAKLDKQVKVILNKIEVNNLLKEIDIEELKLIAQNNKNMNTSLDKMMIKLNSSINE
jgi:hypothetical protein